MTRTWNTIRIPEITSPPSGRMRYKEKDEDNKDSKDPGNRQKETAKHNILLSSMEENSPKKSSQRVYLQKEGLRKETSQKETPLKKFLQKKKAKKGW